MKVTVDPNGVVSLDVSNGETKVAIDFIRQLQKESKASKLKPKEKPRKAFQRKDKDAGLNASLFDALKFLAANDTEDGITAAQLAQHAKITNGAAGQRIAKLVKAGYAYRVKMGHYRAVKPSE